jgi:hypothetical protein
MYRSNFIHTHTHTHTHTRRERGESVNLGRGAGHTRLQNEGEGQSARRRCAPHPPAIHPLPIHCLYSLVLCSNTLRKQETHKSNCLQVRRCFSSLPRLRFNSRAFQIYLPQKWLIFFRKIKKLLIDFWILPNHIQIFFSLGISQLITSISRRFLLFL